MKLGKKALVIAALLPAIAVMTSCSSQPQSEGLSLQDSCESLSGITSQLAEGIGLAQDDPTHSQQHLDYAREALDSLTSINSTDESFNSATSAVADKFGVFLDELQGAIDNGGGVEDPAILESREAARTAGQLLDQVCQ